MEPFKNKYNAKSVAKISKNIKDVYSSFNSKKFEASLNDRILKSLEMKERVALIAQQIKAFLPKDYKTSINILVKTLAPEGAYSPESLGAAKKPHKQLSGFLVWPLTHFVETQGLGEFDTSMKALYEMTKRFTSEFALRSFLNKDDARVFDYLNSWKTDESAHVRRLCSEGTRPNLPWGLKVDSINANLKRNVRLLEFLKDDPQEYVRRSVANHMNDISRRDKTLFFKTCTSWQSSSREQKRLIQHASRSLLKAGEPQALKLNGYHPRAKVKASRFLVSPRTLKEGQKITLRLSLTNESSKQNNILVNYTLYFVKKNSQLSPKVFHWKKTYLAPKQKLNLEKEFLFKKVTTRKHYPGKHFVEIVVNGKALGKKSFQLKI